MSYCVSMTFFKATEILDSQFESNSPAQILAAFDNIDWTKQIAWSMLEEHQGEFFDFKIEHIHSGRNIAGLLMVYDQLQYHFHVETALYQKQEKSYLFGLIKSNKLPVFESEYVPFKAFRQGLKSFLDGNDQAVQLMCDTYFPTTNK